MRKKKKEIGRKKKDERKKNERKREKERREERRKEDHMCRSGQTRALYYLFEVLSISCSGQTVYIFDINLLIVDGITCLNNM